MKVVVDIPEGHLRTLRQLGGLGYYHEVIAKGQPLSEILDKISAEIDGLHQKPVGFENEYEGGYNHAVDSVLDVIEKYKGVSE